MFRKKEMNGSEVLPYAIYGEICARDLCGSQEGLEIEKRQRELFLRQISPLDFLIHSSSSPWSQSYKMCLWEQSRALHALLYWYMEEIGSYHEKNGRYFIPYVPSIWKSADVCP